MSRALVQICRNAAQVLLLCRSESRSCCKIPLFVAVLPGLLQSVAVLSRRAACCCKCSGFVATCPESVATSARLLQNCRNVSQLVESCRRVDAFVATLSQGVAAPLERSRHLPICCNVVALCRSFSRGAATSACWSRSCRDVSQGVGELSQRSPFAFWDTIARHELTNR